MLASAVCDDNDYQKCYNCKDKNSEAFVKCGFQFVRAFVHDRIILGVLANTSKRRYMQTLFTGIQPTNDLTIGNYISLRIFLRSRTIANLFFGGKPSCDHGSKGSKTLREMVRRLFALYVVAGVDTDKSILFVQSDVPEHCRLSWLLTCNSYMGELNRMTQFKDKVQEAVWSGRCTKRGRRKRRWRHKHTGLYMYPVLMGAGHTAL